jgi:hypothetical protein
LLLSIYKDYIDYLHFHIFWWTLITTGKSGTAKFEDQWNQLKDAGKRWIAEIIFSSIKPVLGEDLLSKNLVHRK